MRQKKKDWETLFEGFVLGFFFGALLAIIVDGLNR